MGNLTQLKQLTALSDEKQKTVLDTVHAITDERSFVESDKFILSQTSLGEAVGEGVVSGFATIDDVQVAIFATNPSVLKGSIGKAGADKIARLAQKAIETESPLIAILDTAGARFAEGIEALEGYGKILRAFSLCYGSVPIICVVKGSSFGLSTYLSGICDLCVAYEKAVIATSSPLILAGGTKIDVSKVGTAAVHSSESGLISRVVKNDIELKDVLSKFLNFIQMPVISSEDDGNRVCAVLRDGEKPNAVLVEAFDTDSFFPVRHSFDEGATVTGFARLGGVAVGVVSVCGRLSANGAVKITELVNTCDSFGLPIVNVVDCVGIENNLKNENTSLIRETANLIFAYNNANVAKIALITGSAVGVGYTAFAGKSVCDYSLAWCGASIGALGDIAAANLMYGAEIARATDKAKAEEKMAQAYNEENSSALVVAQKGFIDNVIDPSLTRPYLIAAVQMLAGKR